MTRRSNETLDRRICVLLTLALILVPQALTPWNSELRPATRFQAVPIEDPLGHFEGVGIQGSVSWTGDGQRLANPSFETGLAPWIQSQSNMGNGSTITRTSPGYVDSTSAQLSVNSGNSSVLSLFGNSAEGLTDDTSQQKIVFNTASRFRAVVQIQSITGGTENDRVEVSLTLTTSTGGVRTIHYVFAENSASPGLSPAPANSTTDGYLRVPGFGTANQWIIVDRDLSLDTFSVFSDASTINSVQGISLTVLAQALPGAQNIDPRIKFLPNLGQTVWSNGLTVVNDANNNGRYDSGELIIGCGQGTPTCTVPSDNDAFSVDPSLKFVDSNHNGAWDCYSITNNVCTSGEAVVQDNNLQPHSLVGVVDLDETIRTVIYAQPAPLPGTLLMKLAQGHTQALFDQVELYTATNGYDWVRNGGFEAGLTGWYTNSTFSSSTIPVHSPTKSTMATVTGGAAEAAQSFDAKPQVDAGMTLKAFAFIGLMTGTSASDSVDLWISLDDSLGHSLSLYYYFKTGTGTIPANRTDVVYLKATGFGSNGQWLSVNANLLQTVQSAVSSNGLAYSSPYQVEAIVLEASASTFKTTIASFDDVSLGSPTTQSEPASSYFYAKDGQDTTYVYAALSIPTGAFSIDVPSGRTLLNITLSGGTALQPGDYTTSVSSGIRRITVLDSASFKGPIVADWKFFTASTNGIASVYAEDPTSLAPAPSIILDSTVNFVSRSEDPFNQPLQNQPANLTLWNTNGVEVGPGWAGMTSSQGWWNASSITLPLAGTGLGFYKLQATVLSLYPGIRTFQLNVHYTAIIDVALSTNDTNAGNGITITGTVTRTDTNTPAQGVNVTIYYRLAGDSQWTNLATIKTDSSGRYTYTWTPPEGEYQVMASTSDSQTGIVNSTLAHLIVNPAGLPWLIIAVVAAAAAAGILAVFVMLRRRKKPAAIGQPSSPKMP